MIRTRPTSWQLALLLGVLATSSACAGDPARVDESGGSSAVVAANAPRYVTFELKARSELDPYASASSFDLPAGSYFKNISPSLNDQGDIVINFQTTIDGVHHVWKNGTVVFDGPDAESYISRTALNAQGDIAFDMIDGVSGNGVWLHRAATGQTAYFSSEPLGAEAWGNLHLAEDGRVGCRPGAGNRNYLGILSGDSFTRFAVETSTNPNSPYAYLFGPSFDHDLRATLKVQLAQGGTDIRVLSSSAAPVVVVRDRDADPSSPYAKFDNTVSSNDRGQIAFIARGVDGKRGVFRAEGTNGRVTHLAQEGQGGIATLAFFVPVMNELGQVAFKGEDTEGRNAIWLADGDELTKIISAGDPLPSDQGEVLALPETDTDPQNRTAFGGNLALNARGDIVFLAAIVQRNSGTTRRLGTALYVARAPR